jgi:hypothetical protein
MPVTPPQRRSTVQQTAEGVRYEMPPKRHLFALVFLPVWLVGWCIGEIAVIRELLWARGANLFLIVLLLAWTFGGAFALFAFLWQLAGKDVVIITPDALTVKREIAGFGWAREYDREHVRDLRVASESEDGVSRALAGPIEFAYGSKTYRFGGGIDEEEARMVVVEMGQQGLCP